MLKHAISASKQASASSCLVALVTGKGIFEQLEMSSGLVLLVLTVFQFQSEVKAWKTDLATPGQAKLMACLLL